MLHDGTMPKPEPMMTKIYDTTCSSLGHNELIQRDGPQYWDFNENIFFIFYLIRLRLKSIMQIIHFLNECQKKF